MIKEKCNHEWEKTSNAAYNIETGSTPAYYMCKKCRTLMTAPEVFQLEELENQSKTLKYITGFQKWISVAMAIIAILSLLIAFFK